MPILRKIFFYIFVAIYLTVCPLLILRMLGFVIDPLSHHLVKTGIIYVSTNPPGADVYINDLLGHETTPAIIRDLLPNNYTIRLELKGYQIWQNTIPVVDRKATVLENILLIPKQWTVKPLSGVPFENILALGDDNILLLWKEPNIKSLYFLKLNKATDDNNSLADVSPVSSVFPPESIYNNAKIVHFYTVEKSPFFILHVLDEEKHKYLWIDMRDKQIHIEDISDLLPQEPVKLWWEYNDEKILYAYLSDRTNRIDIKAKAIYPDIPLKDIPLPNDRRSSQSRAENEFLLSKTDIKGKDYDENDDLWLEFTAKKIGLWSNNQKDIQWIFKNGHSIEQAFWANNGSTILFRDSNQVYLLDKEPFSQSKLEKVTNICPDSTIYYSEKTGKLYYIEPFNKLLSAITILRHRPILPKNIADTLRLKEFEP